MNSAVVVIFCVFLVFYIWLSRTMFQIALACWKPDKAKQPWLNVVNHHERRFFTLFKWVSPPLAVGASLGTITVVVLLAKELTLGIAS